MKKLMFLILTALFIFSTTTSTLAATFDSISSFDNSQLVFLDDEDDEDEDEDVDDEDDDDDSDDSDDDGDGGDDGDE